MTRPALVVFSGLPGTGKTTLARPLAEILPAVYLGVDAVEEALRRSALAPADVMDAGYRALWALAAENLALGLPVVGDSVNPVSASRAGWRNVAHRTGARLLEVEVICSDAALHRSRVEARHAAGIGPDWAAVEARRYAPRTDPRIVLDTARTPEELLLADLVEHIDRAPF